MLWWREKSGNAVPRTAAAKHRLRNRGLYIMLPIGSIVIWLSPGSDWLDRSFPMVVLAIVGVADMYCWMRQRRDLREAAA